MTERRPHSDWLEIEPILDRLLELPSGDREEALTGLSASLRAQIEPLLEDIDGEETDLRGLLVSRFGQLVEADQTALEAPQLPGLGPGARLGVYRLERSLGRGGMGEVFLAKRVDGQFEQTVAIKIIRGDVEAAKVRDRFLLERQILAHLQHPGIARLLDGGLSAAGVPFYVMEYVEGEPITEYCDRRRLDVDARLRLFQQVCAAVRYAHQNLVVHRDLKPSNVLVTESGAVKLLDFGIAKLLGGSRRR